MPGFSPLMNKGAPTQSPIWRLGLRIFILVLAIIVLGLSAWTISLFDSDSSVDTSPFGSLGGFGSGFGFRKRADFSDFLNVETPPGKEPASLMIYVCIQTLIVVGGALAVEFFAPHLFLRIAVTVGYILTAIMILVGWAYMASSAKQWGDIKSLFDEALGLLGESSGSSPIAKIHSAESAAAGLGALMWILVIVETAIFVMACMKEPSEEGLPTTQMNVMPQKQEQYAQQPMAAPPQTYQQGQNVYQQPAPGYSQ